MGPRVSSEERCALVQRYVSSPVMTRACADDIGMSIARVRVLVHLLSAFSLVEAADVMRWQVAVPCCRSMAIFVGTCPPGTRNSFRTFCAGRSPQSGASG